MSTKFELLTKPYCNLLLENLKKLVKIDSTNDPSSISEKDPFGKGVSTCLQEVENIAKNDGFKTHNYDNKVVEILFGEGDKNITILAHADVVPAGDGWEHDPFTVFEKDGILYGRGVADDKGPLLSAYYALKALVDNNMLSNNYQIRFLVGGNEEIASLGMVHYFEVLKKPQPTYGFSPDASFPLIYAEKATMNFNAITHLNIKDFVSIDAGVAANAVIDKAVLTMVKSKEFDDFITNNYKKETAILNHENGHSVVTFIGKAAHGSLPHLGVNSGIIALEALAKYSNDKNLLTLLEKITPLDASGLNAQGYNEDMGQNTLNIGIIKGNNEKLVVVGNYRHINTTPQEKMIENIKKSLSFCDDVVLNNATRVLYYSKESKLIKRLMKAYKEETNEQDAKPLSSGGGTYAKECDNVVAFGIEKADFDAYMHTAKERVKKSDLFKAMAIYARAILELGHQIDEDKIQGLD